jgi:DNA mismatch repair protein MutL
VNNGLGMSVLMRVCLLNVMLHQKYLFSLHTKGFRGEALASIAAIAHVEMKTKQDQENWGRKLSLKEASSYKRWPFCQASFAVKICFLTSRSP